MDESETQCPKRQQIEEYCSCPKLDCPRHGLCCECIVAHKARVEEPVLKRLPHCLRDMVAGAHEQQG